MNRQTVKRKIFNSNAIMILVALGLMAVVNILFLKLYWENLEREWQNSMQSVVDTTTMENVLKEWTLHQHSFYFVLGIDVLICVAILILVSFFFTKRLVNHIMIPVTLLEKGANRIQENVLTEKIVYNGDKEFENICNTFNTIQEHILSEQEKNKKYEQARTEMIAGISHDLKTPLTAIKGTIKSLIDGVVTTPEQEEKFLKTAYRRTNDMDALLNQLFYLSKLETGNMPLNLTKTDLKSFIKNYVDNLNANLFDEQIEAITHIDCEECITYIDSELFKRVLDNLTENSKKYCNASPIKIEITLKQKDNNLLIGFSDNGIGVSEDKITHIFDEFYRADESRNVCKGNGLGLYIVKKIVESMQGKVYAKNENGLSIYIELPKARN